MRECLWIAAAWLALAVNGAPKNSSRPADLTLGDIHGGRAHLREYRGRIVVLNFWATWCGPCQEEMPLLAAAEKEYKARGVAFIGASLDESKTRGSIPEFLAKHGVEFPVWINATAGDLAKLRMGEAVPATAFLDRDGVIVARVSGQMRREELKERLEWLLSDRSRTAPQALVRHLEK
jgi:thiol-disulfide isomerase/thioredoxin